MRWRTVVPKSVETFVPVIPQMRAQIQEMRRELHLLCGEIVATSVALEHMAIHLERMETHLQQTQESTMLTPSVEPKEFTHERRQR